ncbi:MAG: hypothetical protein ACSHYF_04645 [Verrucomicrobiaceae bacterium]
MKQLIFSTLLSCLLSTASLAQQVINYPAEEPVFSISFPDEWTLTMEDESVSASSKDELANMELVVFEAEALDDAIKMAKEGLKEELKGIQFSDDPAKGKLNEIDVIFLNAKVTMEEVDFAVNCCVFTPKDSEESFMLFNIIPIEALEKHAKAITGILNSVKSK